MNILTLVRIYSLQVFYIYFQNIKAYSISAFCQMDLASTMQTQPENASILCYFKTKRIFFLRGICWLQICCTIHIIGFQKAWFLLYDEFIFLKIVCMMLWPRFSFHEHCMPMCVQASPASSRAMPVSIVQCNLEE